VKHNLVSRLKMVWSSVVKLGVRAALWVCSKLKFVWKILRQLWAFFCWSDDNERGYYAGPQKNHHHGWRQERPVPGRVESPAPRRAERPVMRRAERPMPRRAESPDDYGSPGISYSNPRNNHDDEKVKHPSQESAQAEARRMQAGGSRTLNVYYNRELDGWYIGRSKRQVKTDHNNKDGY
jgi:hypothetical protein